MKNVPFADLHAQYLSIKDEIDEAIAGVIADSAFIRGPRVEHFENEFANLVGASQCVSCANGTDAIYIAMKGLGIQPGDEVIVPAMSWISTSETVTQAGGKVVFCDIEPHSYTLDTSHLENLITARTVGIIPVHLYGQPANMEKIMTIAEGRGLWVIEDCAQAHLAQFNDHQVGSFGNAATFSFYPGKNLGAMGDAGAIVTNDVSLSDRMAMFARHGGLVKGDHTIEGINSRLDGIQAAILLVKLAHLPNWTARRREIAARYNTLLQDIDGLHLPQIAKGCEPVWHLYVVRHDRRDELANYLKSEGIQTVINYPRALPFLPCYSHLGHSQNNFPVAYELGQTCLSLPIFPEMSEEQIITVADALREFRGVVRKE